MVHSLALKKNPTRKTGQPKLHVIRGGSISLSREALDRKIAMHEDALQFLGKQDLNARDKEAFKLRNNYVNATATELTALKNRRDNLDLAERRAAREASHLNVRTVNQLKRKTI